MRHNGQSTFFPYNDEEKQWQQFILATDLRHSFAIAVANIIQGHLHWLRFLLAVTPWMHTYYFAVLLSILKIQFDFIGLSKTFSGEEKGSLKMPLQIKRNVVDHVLHVQLINHWPDHCGYSVLRCCLHEAPKWSTKGYDAICSHNVYNKSIVIVLFWILKISNKVCRPYETIKIQQHLGYSCRSA